MSYETTEGGAEQQERSKARERISDRELGGLLAGIGNHEGKALLLVSMAPGRAYTRADLGAKAKAHQSARDTWSDGLGFSWCQGSLAPIGLVARELVDPEQGIYGYEKTERGRDLGDALAGHLLVFSERHPELSLYKVFGATQSTGVIRGGPPGSIEGEVDKNRAPLTRFRILKKLATRRDPVHEHDLIDALAADYPLDYRDPPIGTAVLRGLAEAGLITYRSRGQGKPYRLYTYASEAPEGAPPSYPGEPWLTQTVSAGLASLTGKEGQSVTISDVVTVIRSQHQHLQNTNEHYLYGRVGKILRSLERDGYAVSHGEISPGDQTLISVAPEQRETVEGLISIVDRFQRASTGEDEEFLREGRQRAAEILADPARYAALMQKARDASPYTAARPREETTSVITSFLDEHPDSTAKDVRAYLAARGQQLSDHAVIRFLRESVRSELLEKRQVKGKYLYSRRVQRGRKDMEPRQ